MHLYITLHIIFQFSTPKKKHSLSSHSGSDDDTDHVASDDESDHTSPPPPPRPSPRPSQGKGGGRDDCVPSTVGDFVTLVTCTDSPVSTPALHAGIPASKKIYCNQL